MNNIEKRWDIIEIPTDKTATHIKMGGKHKQAQRTKNNMKVNFIV